MGSSGGSSEHFLRQFSASDGAPLPRELGEEWAAAECGRRGSRRWSRKKARGHHRRGGGGGGLCRSREEAPAGRKRVMVVVDQSSGAKHAMMWALTHVANKGDFLTLLHVLPYAGAGRGEETPSLANSLGTLCKACRPEVAYTRIRTSYVHDVSFFFFIFFRGMHVILCAVFTFVL